MYQVDVNNSLILGPGSNPRKKQKKSYIWEVKYRPTKAKLWGIDKKAKLWGIESENINMIIWNK